MRSQVSSGWHKSQAQYNCRAVRRPWCAINSVLLAFCLLAPTQASSQQTWQFELNLQPTVPHTKFQFIRSGVGYGAGIVRTVHEHIDLAVTVGRVSLAFDTSAYSEVVQVPESDTPIGGSSGLNTFHFELRVSPISTESALRPFGVLGIGGFVEHRGARGTIERGVLTPSRSESGVLASYGLGAEYWMFESVGLRTQAMWMSDGNDRRLPGRVVAFTWSTGIVIRGL